MPLLVAVMGALGVPRTTGCALVLEAEGPPCSRGGSAALLDFKAAHQAGVVSPWAMMGQ